MKIVFIKTGKGYWGKGDSFTSACKEANVNSQWVHAHIYIADTKFISDIVFNGNGVDLIYTEEFLSSGFEHSFAACHSYYGEIKMTKGEPVLKIELDD